MPLIPLTTQENKRMREGEATPPRPKESIRRDLIDALRMVRGIEYTCHGTHVRIHVQGESEAPMVLFGVIVNRNT